jgi:hypothetical protein
VYSKKIESTAATPRATTSRAGLRVDTARV